MNNNKPQKMNFTDSFLNGSSFLSYLCTNNNGSYQKLCQTIMHLETIDPNFNLNCFLTRQHDKVIYEVPTDELCTVLSRIIDTPVIEVGAGLGLLTARLLHTTDIPIIATSEYSNTFRIKHNYNYCNVLNLPFTGVSRLFDNKKYQTIIISWMHSSSQYKFMKMINKMQPKTVIHVGEHNGCCYDDEFVEQMADLGYSYFYLLPIKQISQMDYFCKDNIRGENCTRTCTTVFSKTRIELLEGNFREKLGIGNFGQYLDCSGQYAIQDQRVILPMINKLNFDAKMQPCLPLDVFSGIGTGKSCGIFRVCEEFLSLRATMDNSMLLSSSMPGTGKTCIIRGFTKHLAHHFDSEKKPVDSPSTDYSISDNDSWIHSYRPSPIDEIILVDSSSTDDCISDMNTQSVANNLDDPEKIHRDACIKAYKHFNPPMDNITMKHMFDEHEKVEIDFLRQEIGDLNIPDNMTKFTQIRDYLQTVKESLLSQLISDDDGSNISDLDLNLGTGKCFMSLSESFKNPLPLIIVNKKFAQTWKEIIEAMMFASSFAAIYYIRHQQEEQFINKWESVCAQLESILESISSPIKQVVGKAIRHASHADLSLNNNERNIDVKIMPQSESFKNPLPLLIIDKKFVTTSTTSNLFDMLDNEMIESVMFTMIFTLIYYAEKQRRGQIIKEWEEACAQGSILKWKSSPIQQVVGKAIRHASHADFLPPRTTNNRRLRMGIMLKDKDEDRVPSSNSIRLIDYNRVTSRANYPINRRRQPRYNIMRKKYSLQPRYK